MSEGALICDWTLFPISCAIKLLEDTGGDPIALQLHTPTDAEPTFTEPRDAELCGCSTGDASCTGEGM